MGQVTLGGNKVQVAGELPGVGSSAPEFTLTKNDLTEVSLSDFKGKKVILNIFPSVDTGVCATSVRTFNQKLATLENTVVLCISKDLPFAQARFCGAEGIENAITLSAFRNGTFADDYGVGLQDGAFEGLFARSIVLIKEDGTVGYTQLVGEIGQEPDYEAAVKAL